jgi:hypothetical protein
LLNKVEDLTKGSEQVDTFTNSIDGLAKKLQNFNLTEWFSGLGPKLKAVGQGFLNAARSVLEFLGSIWPLLILLAALTAAMIGLVAYIKHL